MSDRDPLPREIFLRGVASAALTIAAFCYAVAIFFVVEKQLRHLAPTAPVAIGRVTVEHASKSHDYAAFALFVLVASLGTLLLRAVAERVLRKYGTPRGDAGALRTALLFSLPFLLAPFLWLTTGKEGWALVLAPALAAAALAAERPAALRLLHRLRAPETEPFVALLLCEISSWILFRYLATGKRIAHIPTLFLEVVFVAFFLLVGLGAALVMARVLALTTGMNKGRAIAGVSLALWPFLVLTPIGIALVPPAPFLLMTVAVAATTAVLLRRRDLVDLAPRVRNVVAWLIVPAMLFAFSYASTASISTWVDLFHRGETLGPASDYLRGKLPYRDVFVLHGMLEDGLLDSWLMSIFGRDATVALTRIALIGASTLPILYLVSLTIFDSILGALATVALGMFTFVDNQRVVFHLLVVLLMLAALRRSKWWALLCGGASAFAIFYSLDIGLYAVAGCVVACVVLSFTKARGKLPAVATLYIAGVVVGSLPFLIYLGSRGVLVAFFSTSFSEVPAVIDAVWSLPYPDLAATFRSDLSLRTLSDFILGEKLRFVLNPLVIAIAVAYCIALLRRRSEEWRTIALVVLVSAALFAQRSALGRADFQHQYFAAYLLAPILLLLVSASCNRVKTWPSAATTPFVALLVLTVSGIAFAFFWVPDLLNSRIDALVGYRPRVAMQSYADPQADAVARRVLLTRAAIASEVPKSQPIFDFSNQPALYFFSERSNASRFYQIPIASPLRYQQEIIHELSAKRPRIVLRGSPEGFDRFDGIANESRAPLVASFIDQWYTFERSVEGIELWRLRNIPPASPAPTVPLNATIGIPKELATEASEALLFPAVGSVVGASGAAWKSDLNISNPFERTITLRLRYLGSRGNSERRIAIPPRHATVLRDVVATFFGQPESRGACLIRYENGFRPVISLSTYESGREESFSTELPLTSSASARGGTTRDELIVAGVADSGTHRVNIGLANPGTGTATYDMYVLTQAGTRVGVPVSGALAEGATTVFVNVGDRLGVPLDQTLTVVVRVKRGELVGYASVIDGATGAHFSVPAVAVERP